MADAAAGTVADTLNPGPLLLSLPRVPDIRQHEREQKRHRSHAAQNPYPHQAMAPPLVLGILVLHDFMKCGDVHGCAR